MSLLIIEHAEHRGDAIKQIVDDAHVNNKLVKTYLGEKLPKLDNFSGVISGGGPMGVYEMNNPKYNFLYEESVYLQEAIDKGKAVLGICLGHQLLAKVLGGEIERDEKCRETTWSKIKLTSEGLKDDLFKDVNNGALYSFQYHYDKISIPPKDIKHLAYNNLTSIQAFRYNEQPVWGVQFHPEISPDMAKVILNNNKDKLEKMGVDIFLAIDEGYKRDNGSRLQVFYNFLRLIK